MSEETKNLFDLAVMFIDGDEDERSAIASLLLDALAQTKETVEYDDGSTSPAVIDGFEIEYEGSRIGIEISVCLLPESVG